MSIRIATRDDVPAILEIYKPYVEKTAITFEYDVPTQEAFDQRFQKITRQFPWLVWEEAGKILGYAYADAPFERAAFCWCEEASVYLAPEVQRKGLGTALYKALEAALTQQGYYVIYAIITTENAASIAFHEALGYRRLGDFPTCGFKQDAWHGITWMEKRLQNTGKPVEKPVQFPEIINY